jgi:hypothetical protein
MKTKPLTFLLALTFLFLFSGSSLAGIFSPDDYNDCIFKNMKTVENNIAVFDIESACKSKFPKEPPKGASGLFGPKSYADCVLKYSKGIKFPLAQGIIESTCRIKFKNSTTSNRTEIPPEENQKNIPEILRTPEPFSLGSKEPSGFFGPGPSYIDCKTLKNYEDEKLQREELTLMGVIQKDTLKPIPDRLDKIDEEDCRKKFKDEIYE